MYFPEAFPSAYPGAKLLYPAPAFSSEWALQKTEFLSYGGGFRIQMFTPAYSVPPAKVNCLHDMMSKHELQNKYPGNKN
jgi:hypothetical protein